MSITIYSALYHLPRPLPTTSVIIANYHVLFNKEKPAFPVLLPLHFSCALVKRDVQCPANTTTYVLPSGFSSSYRVFPSLSLVKIYVSSSYVSTFFMKTSWSSFFPVLSPHCTLFIPTIGQCIPPLTDRQTDTQELHLTDLCLLSGAFVFSTWKHFMNAH